jgi:heat shock protein 4
MNVLTLLPPVVGVDFGTLNTVIAVARNRGVDVIVNEVR